LKTIKSIIEHTNPTEEADIWLDTFPRIDPSLTLARINLRTARLCCDAQQLFDSDTQSKWWIIKILELVKEAVLLDQKYQEWSGSLPASWRHRVVRTSTTSSTGSSDPGTSRGATPQHVYKDIYVAFTSNNCRGARLHLHEILLRCIALIESHPLADSFDSVQIREQSRLVITDMISEICASVPFCLGDINSIGQPPTEGNSRPPLGGYLTLWSLWLAQVSAPEGSETRTWLGGKLEYVSACLGIRAAKTISERNRDNPWDLRVEGCR
jgi:hypothetical protein